MTKEMGGKRGEMERGRQGEEGAERPGGRQSIHYISSS